MARSRQVPSRSTQARVPRRPTFISLYSGAGGLDAGFIAAGFEPIWANDLNPFAVESYNANIPGEHAHCGDIDLLCSGLPAGGEVDVVIGGPPCQGFSVAGRMSPDDPRSEHVWKFLDLIRHLQPRAFVMENVAALAIGARWAPLVAALRTRAKRLGYEVEIFVLNGADFGVPQNRRRMFMVGIHGVTPIEPLATTSAYPKTVRQALGELPPWGQPGNDSLCTAVVSPARNPVLRRSPYAGLLFDGNGRVMNLDAPALTLPASMGGNRTPVIDQEWLEGGSNWIEWYHRRLTRGGRPVKRPPSRLRRLTVEEAAALQSFPRGWSFAGPQSAQFRQIGNAVPPDLAGAVAKSIDTSLQLAPVRFESRLAA